MSQQNLKIKKVNIHLDKRTFVLPIVYTFMISFGNAQTNDSLFTRLRGIRITGIDFFDMDGMEISVQKVNADFIPKSISKKFKNLSVKQHEIVLSDSLLGFPNYYVHKEIIGPDSMTNNMSYYFFQMPDNKIAGISYIAVNKTDRELERHFANLVKNNQIPKEVFSELDADTIDFAGRKIELGGVCHWMGVNNMQCSGHGQMNWSVHKNLDDAKRSIDDQFAAIRLKSGGKVISDSTVMVVFEGEETPAKKIIYDITGVNSLLAGMSGGKTLTVYFVAAHVRNNSVSCVMSFWNNDNIRPSGLPALLEEVMHLK